MIKIIIICLLLALLCAGCGDPDVTETEAIPEIEEPKLTIHNDTKFDLDVFYTPSEGVEVTATIMSGGSFEVEEDVEELTIIEGSF